MLLLSGKTGIRTLGTRKGTTVFETVPIDHSGIFPWSLKLMQSYKSFLVGRIIFALFLEQV